MIKLYKDIIARAFFVALTTLLSAYIAGVTVGVTDAPTIAAFAVGAATGTIHRIFCLNKDKL